MLAYPCERPWFHPWFRLGFAWFRLVAATMNVGISMRKALVSPFGFALVWLGFAWFRLGFTLVSPWLRFGIVWFCLGFALASTCLRLGFALASSCFCLGVFGFANICTTSSSLKTQNITANSPAGPNGFRKFDFLKERNYIFHFQHVLVLADAACSLSN